ncbi:carbonic anhydrase [Segnochrobactrum spirostomi]|uniref:carbonic anhydrase n=1 Tax=Segnochrobactrum spirostomi TaxID=2608987 RepID=A0A6A7Y2P2_9HYPH|nr:carbonic anhydrase [Segnochrobactrum spirostomi]MQT13364.1 carbonic anhydrase [Segnochrobactrum spirostomi]
MSEHAGTYLPPRLVAGYSAFANGRLSEERSRYRHLAETGQRPEIMVVSCCDSRCAPETIFDAGPGEMFVLRNVANLVPPYAPDGEYHGTSAALEFGVMGLGIGHVVVLGHGRCGGIKAFRATGEAPLSPGDFIGRWITLLEPAAARLACDPIDAGIDGQTALERMSVRQSIANLRTFPWVREREAAGTLVIHGAWFDISTGELFALADDGRFVPVAA